MGRMFGLEKARNSKIFRFFIVISLLIGGSSNLSASEASSDEEFKPGEIIMHHVMDAHEIHIMEGVHIPLPVIVKAPNALDVFSYSKFTQKEGAEFKTYTSSSSGNTYAYDHGHIYMINQEGEIKLDEEGNKVAPYDLSITKNVAGMFVAFILMFLIFISVARSYKKRKGEAPKGLQSWVEPIIVFIRDDVAKPSIGHGYERFMPFLLSIFFFIWISNMMGLIPFLGGMNITGNIAVTAVLAVFTFIVTTINGNKSYWMHIVLPPGVPFWLLPIMWPIELLGVFSKPIVLCLRLFANITAGHIIILSFTMLIFIFAKSSGVGVAYGVSVGTLIFSIFMNVLELLVAFLQAYVFTLLSALYFGQATEEAH